ncbi:hypothetical protein KAT51_08655 [bacterium]|nr:hypothetical protein [bacterium]
MKAKEILEGFVKKEVRDKVEVVAIGAFGGKSRNLWMHLKEDDELPNLENFDIVIHINQREIWRIR